MTRIKYVSVHERGDGKRRIKPGKGDREHSTIRLPKSDNSLDSFETHDWERIDYWKLPEEMPKSQFTDWWNNHLRAENEPDVIHDVLVAMGERAELEVDG